MLDNRYLYSSFVDAYGREVLARYFFESEFKVTKNKKYF